MFLNSIALEIANSFIAAGDEDAFFIFDDRNDMIVDGVIYGNDSMEINPSKEAGFVHIRGGLRFYETLQAAKDAVGPDTVGGSHSYISILKVKLPKFCTVWFDDSIPERVMYIAPALLLPEPKMKSNS